MGKWEASRGGEQMQQALCRMWFDIVNRVYEIRDGERLQLSTGS